MAESLSYHFYIPSTVRELRQALKKVYPQDARINRMKKKQLVAYFISVRKRQTNFQPLY